MSAPLLSVVIPTYNEEANIAPLLQALRTALGSIAYEAIVVDDDSKDKTAAFARQAGARVLVRKGERGLATAVVRGLREARGAYVAVMDADFQHPPEAVVALLQKALDEGADLVIGSRYAQGGSQGNFGPIRRVLSWGASTLGKLALPPIRKFKVTDPMSGLFLVRRDAVDLDALRPQGYKILLEVLGRCPLAKVVEVGYAFQDRRGGDSKLGAGVMAHYVAHVARLGWDHPENHRAARFALVGASGVLVNLALLWLLHGQLKVHDLVAVPIAVEASILSNFLLNDRFTFHDRRHDHVLQRLAKFNAVSLVALAINFLAYALLTRGFGVHYLLAQFLAIVVAFGANYLGNLHWTYGGTDGFKLRRSLRRLAPFAPILLLTGAAAGVYFDDLDRVPELYFDEHYYVSVARQIDNGIWEDPCWEGDGELAHRPLNYEHPPLAKLLMAWSVIRLDTDHAVFEGCRAPDDTNTQDCNVVEHGEIVATTTSRKACYDAYTARAKDLGNPIAWRLPSALFGVACVLFIALAAQRLFGSVLAGMLAGTLVLLDTLVYSSARIALLDIFAAGFVAMAAYAATFPSRKGVFFTALFLGLGFASKYTVVFAGPGIALLSLWTQRRAGLLTRRRFDLNVAAFVLVPLAVWLATYAPWWALWVPEMGLVGSIQHWLHVQGAAFKWGATGYQVHAYASQPAEWLIQARPTFYYHVWGFADGKEGWVYALGNPLLWAAFSLAVVGVLVAVVARWGLALRHGWSNPLRFFAGLPRDTQATAVTALLAGSSYGFFFLVERVTFLFYMTLVVPIACLPLAGVLQAAWRRGAAGRIVVAAVLVAILAAMVHYLPVVAAEPITPARFQAIMDRLPWMRE